MASTAGVATIATGIRQWGILGLLLGGIGTGMVVLAITNERVLMIDRASEIAEKPSITPFPERAAKSLLIWGSNHLRLQGFCHGKICFRPNCPQNVGSR